METNRNDQWRETTVRSRSKYGTRIGVLPGKVGYHNATFWLPYTWESVRLTPALVEGFAQIEWRGRSGWIDLRGIEEKPSSPVPDRAGVMELMNRLQHFRPTALREDVRLIAAAYDQAIWIANTDEYTTSHRPDHSVPLHRALDQGYDAQYIEELAYGSADRDQKAADAWRYWMTFPRSRDLVRSVDFCDVGIASAHGVWGNAWVIVVARHAPPRRFPRVRRRHLD